MTCAIVDVSSVWIGDAGPEIDICYPGGVLADGSWIEVVGTPRIRLDDRVVATVIPTSYGYRLQNWRLGLTFVTASGLYDGQRQPISWVDSVRVTYASRVGDTYDVEALREVFVAIAAGVEL